MAHPRAVVLAWLCGSLACGVLASILPGDIAADGVSVPGSQSTRAEQLARRYIPGFAGPTLIVVLIDDRPSSGSQAHAELAAAIGPVARLHGVLGAEEAASAPFREAPSQRPGYLAAYLIRMDISYTAAEQRIPAIEAALRRDSRADVSFALFGEAVDAYRYAAIVRRDLARAELIAVPIAFCMLLVAFLSAVAAVLPILSAAAVLACTLALVHVISLTFGLSVFVLNTAASVALGLSIDYTLMIVTRFREERTTGRSVEHAVARAMRSAGRAVVLSGLTVAALLPAVTTVGIGLFTSMALGGIVASLLAVLAATTLLPATLLVLGDRLDRLALRRAVAASRRGTLWRHLADAVTTHPALAALASLAALLALATPALSLRLDFASAALAPARPATAHVEADVRTAFGAGADGLVEVLTQEPRRIAAIVEADPNERTIWRTFSGRDRWADMYVLLATGPDSAQSRTTVARLRRELGGHPSPRALIGGITAGEMDLAARVTRRLPFLIAAAGLIALLALSLGLRSIVIPLKAILCSALSIAATLGVLRACFPSSAIAFFVPILTFALVLGLSVDYEVFLLSRIREPLDAEPAIARAVSYSLTRTARPITLAGLAVASVFAAFAFSSLEAVRELGVAVTAGVLIDITLVRWILSPACIVLAGRWNWWLPRPRAGQSRADGRTP